MELGERVAVIESQIVQIIRANDKQDEHLDQIETLLQGINHKLDRQKGFIGGVIFIVTALATAIGLALQWFSGSHGV